MLRKLICNERYKLLFVSLLTNTSTCTYNPISYSLELTILVLSNSEYMESFVSILYLRFSNHRIRTDWFSVSYLDCPPPIQTWPCSRPRQNFVYPSQYESSYSDFENDGRLPHLRTSFQSRRFRFLIYGVQAISFLVSLTFQYEYECVNFICCF